jgi:dTDP-4-amino-4,6-dideoxygalactose transaminase
MQAVRGELIDAFANVLDGGRYVLGEQVAKFEGEWAQLCEVEHAVGVSSGTDALALALRALGVGPGDEVLVPAMTAIASWMAVAQVGAIPVGVDIASPGWGMDAAAASAAVGTRTRALVAVHLYGQPADVERLGAVAASARIPLVEDAAQAHAATLGGRAVGSLGAISAFSFYPTKNLGAMGDAGAVTTSDSGLAERVRAMREYGWAAGRRDSEMRGVNARLDELQAALLRVRLARLAAESERRRAIAATYLSGLADVDGVELPVVSPHSEPAWHLFVLRHPQRDLLARALSRDGVETAVHYSPAPHLNAIFRAEGSREGAFPNAERHAATALTLPLHAGLSDEDVTHVVESVRGACASLRD